MKHYDIISIALLATLFLGCAVQGPAYKAETNASTKSAVYVYRPYHLWGAAVEYPVSCGDHSTSLGPGGYHMLAVDPGLDAMLKEAAVKLGVLHAAEANSPSTVKVTALLGRAMTR